jgi:hypothetical protein
MNIFATSPCPIECAQYLDDKRVVKMVLETAQVLSTVHHAIYGIKANPKLYKPTHEHHPCTLWAQHSQANYNWLYVHFIALLNVYELRYARKHKCAELIPHLKRTPPIHETKATPFANCCRNKDLGIDFTNHRGSIHDAYKMYLRERWGSDTRVPTWNGNKINPMEEESYGRAA